MKKYPKRKVKEVELIEDAEAQIELLIAGKNFNRRIVAAIEGKLRIISANGAALKDHLPVLINAIDEALIKLYPHKGRWDDGHRSQLINEYVVLTTRITNSDPVIIEDLQKVLKFFKIIRECFQHFHESRS